MLQALAQAYGTLVGSGWMFQMIWRSWWFYGQWIYSIRVLYLRAYNIKHHEKDIGVWLPKDWKMLYHKLARFLFLIPVALILLVDVMPMTNPPIINKAFFEQCQLTPSYEVGLAGSYTIGVSRFLQHVVRSMYPVHPQTARHLAMTAPSR